MLHPGLDTAPDSAPGSAPNPAPDSAFTPVLPENGIETPESRLRLRMGAPEIFHSPLDRTIAIGFLDRLEERQREGLMAPDEYARAITALDDLVPRRNARGLRQIADKTVTPRMEELIASRINSREVDVASPEGSWGSLPEAVKREIARCSNPMIEMLPNCTVGCAFCGGSNKGAIEGKMSRSSILEIIKYFRDNQPCQDEEQREDLLYWNMDPFDAKWLAPESAVGGGSVGSPGSTGSEADYNDLAENYRNLMTGYNRNLYTSTAVPLGEELRVLRFADGVIERGMEGEFRMSLNDANARRVGDIKTILDAIYDRPVPASVMKISINRSKSYTRQGKAWLTHIDVDNLSPMDVIGPGGVEGPVIGLNSVDGVLMVGASNERPVGEERFPVAKMTGGLMTYTIPKYFFQDPQMLVYTKIKEIYPDPQVVEITYDDVGGVTIQERTVTGNPHRALLRMAGVFRHFAVKMGGETDKISAEDKYIFKMFLAKDIELIRAHLASNPDNVAMRIFMERWERDGFV
jgi:hypothetical protein